MSQIKCQMFRLHPIVFISLKAFEMCEVTAMMLFIVWCLVVLFHKHRFIIMRRFFSLCGTIFLLRCITMLITSLSVPGTHLECTPRPYGDIWNKIQSAYSIWSGGGMTLQGVRYRTQRKSHNYYKLDK